jgi:hypothetical protein
MRTTQARDITRLNLLTRDGAISVQFTPPLDQVHYTELFEIAREFETETDAKALVIAAAKRWKRKVAFSGATERVLHQVGSERRRLSWLQ